MVISERRILSTSSRAIAYEPRFDQSKGIKSSYIVRQVETFLGERLNVLLSKNKYEIRNNLIYGKDMADPFVNVIRKGIEYRENAGGKERVDKNREEAELVGFSVIEDILCNPNTPVGTMMLSVSPPGGKDSLYQHNFYDIFTLRQAQGQRFVEARRYSSALSYDEYKDKLKSLYYMEDIVDDADFLSHPIKIDPSTSLRIFFENAGQIHSYLHKDHKFTKEEDFKRILRACRFLNEKYAQTREVGILDAIMNKADMEAGLISTKPAKFYDPLIGPNRELTIEREIAFYAKQPVRTADIGCGPSGGFSANIDKTLNSSPFSVSDFEMTDKYGDRKFECPECGKVNIRPENELVANCQHCNSSKVAC